jgi:hypothetical protein
MAESRKEEVDPAPEEDARVRKEAEEAAREAGAIGGRGGDEDVEEAERPVVEAGGGEAGGFEQAEEELIEHATHGDPAPDPTKQAGEPERERQPGEHGDPDRVESTEVEEGGS